MNNKIYKNIFVIIFSLIILTIIGCIIMLFVANNNEYNNDIINYSPTIVNYDENERIDVSSINEIETTVAGINKEDGIIILNVKNTSSNVAFINDVSIRIDADIYESYISCFVVKPNDNVYVGVNMQNYNMDNIINFDKQCKIEIDVAKKDSIVFKNEIYDNNIYLKTSKTDSLIVNEIINNSNYTLDSLTCGVIFFKDGKALYYKTSYISGNTIKPDSSYYDFISYDDVNVEFDEYKVCILSCEVSKVNGGKEQHIIDNIEVENLGVINNIGILNIKNNSEYDIEFNFDNIRYMFFDNNNNFIGFTSTLSNPNFTVKAKGNTHIKIYDDNLLQYMDNCKLQFENVWDVSEKYSFKNIEINISNENKKIVAEVVNNNNYAIKSIKIYLLLYKDGKISDFYEKPIYSEIESNGKVIIETTKDYDYYDKIETGYYDARIIK